MTPPSSESAAAAPQKTSPWVLGRWRDLLLFVATPIIILPAVTGLTTVIAVASLNKWVMAFGAMGHHLPGMLRAYGDRALFSRFRTRLILSPIILGTLCVLYSVKGWHGMLFMAYVWGIWHGLMQTHGFLRLYDSKRASFARTTAWCDQLMCLTWFLGGVVWSTPRMDYFANVLTQAGGPLLLASQINLMRQIAVVAMAVAAVAFFANAWNQTRRGVPPNPIKLLLLVTSIGWWWWATVGVADVLLGLILFELFHDVQYLAIVWIFNRKRVDDDPQIGAFSRFLFRPSYALMGLYVLMIAGYGAVGPWAEASTAGATREVFAGLVTFSALLHFYFDGFIWKFRSQQIRSGMGVESKSGAPLARAHAMGLKHATKWLFLLVPAIGLGVLEVRNDADELSRTEALAQLHPDQAAAWYRVGMAAKNSGELRRAAEAFEEELKLRPENEGTMARTSRTHLELGEKLVLSGKVEAARPHFARVKALEPAAARLFYLEGQQLLNRGDPGRAVKSLQCSLLIDGEQPNTNLMLAAALHRQGLDKEALRYARNAARLQPKDAKTRKLVRDLEAQIKNSGG